MKKMIGLVFAAIVIASTFSAFCIVTESRALDDVTVQGDRSVSSQPTQNIRESSRFSVIYANSAYYTRLEDGSPSWRATMYIWKSQPYPNGPDPSIPPVWTLVKQAASSDGRLLYEYRLSMLDIKEQKYEKYRCYFKATAYVGIGPELRKDWYDTKVQFFDPPQSMLVIDLKPQQHRSTDKKTKR